MRRALTLIVASVTLSACYHATVETAPGPSAGGVSQQSAAMHGKVIEIPWAHSFIGGLVPP